MFDMSELAFAALMILISPRRRARSAASRGESFGKCSPIPIRAQMDPRRCRAWSLTYCVAFAMLDRSVSISMGAPASFRSE